MRFYLKRKVANQNTKELYQSLTYDVSDNVVEDDPLFIISDMLQHFAIRSNGEFQYCVTNSPTTRENFITVSPEINPSAGEVLYGEKFWEEN